MIAILDPVEKKVVANGTAIIVLQGDRNRGVTDCQMEAGQTLQTGYSYTLINTATQVSLSAECTGLPDPKMQIASFHLD